MFTYPQPMNQKGVPPVSKAYTDIERKGTHTGSNFFEDLFITNTGKQL